MSAAPVAMEAPVEAYQETLTERLGRGALPVAEALRYATQVATCLRDLHMQGLVHGAVSSQLILLGPTGASLRIGASLAQLGDARYDVTGFGDMLGEMLRWVRGPEVLHIEIGRLAIRCQSGALDMQQVLITLRLLAMRARLGAASAPGPVLVGRVEAVRRTVSKEAVLHWIRMARQWKPLASLAAFALSGK
jgi:hypothetical protein